MAQQDNHEPKASTQEQHHGKSGGENTQSQGGIGRRAGAAADKPVNPQAGSPKGAVDVPGPSLDSGGGDNPHDGRAHSGFTGDDGAHQPTDANAGTAASLQPGKMGDLGAQQDQRRHGISEDPAERTTGADTPNAGGIAGSPGGPTEAARVPGQDDDEDATTGGGQSGNDAQRDPQI